MYSKKETENLMNIRFYIAKISKKYGLKCWFKSLAAWFMLRVERGEVKALEDIPAFDTVLFHSTLSSLPRKYLSAGSNRQNSIEFWAKNMKEAFKKTVLVASK